MPAGEAGTRRNTVSEEDTLVRGDQPPARPVNDQELARQQLDEEREPGWLEPGQQETRQAEATQKEKILVDKTLDTAQDKGVVDAIGANSQTAGSR